MTDNTTELTLVEDEFPAVSEHEAKRIASQVQSQLGGLNVIREKVVEATEQARAAQERAINDKVQMGWLGKRKAAIEELQEVVEEMAQAQMSAAQAQELMFIFQTQLANASVYLAGLCAGNAKAGHVVAKEIKQELRNLGRQSDDDQLVEAQRKTMEAVRKQIQGQMKLEKRIQSLEGKHSGSGRVWKVVLWVLLVLVGAYFVVLYLQGEGLLSFSVPGVRDLWQLLTG